MEPEAGGRYESAGHLVRPAGEVGGGWLDVQGPDPGLGIKADVSAAGALAQDVLLFGHPGSHSSLHEHSKAEEISRMGLPSHYRQDLPLQGPELRLALPAA